MHMRACVVGQGSLRKTCLPEILLQVRMLLRCSLTPLPCLHVLRLLRGQHGGIHGGRGCRLSLTRRRRRHRLRISRSASCPRSLGLCREEICKRTAACGLLWCSSFGLGGKELRKSSTNGGFLWRCSLRLCGEKICYSIERFLWHSLRFVGVLRLRVEKTCHLLTRERLGRGNLRTCFRFCGTLAHELEANVGARGTGALRPASRHGADAGWE